MEHHGPIYSDPAAWVGAAFIVFFLLFGARLWKALTQILDKRAATIRAEIAEAQRLRTEAEAMLRDATARRAEAIASATQLLEGARHEATRLGQEAAVEAEAAGRRREKMAMDRIAAAEKAAVDDVRLMAADIAGTAAQQVIRETLTPEADAQLIDNAIAGLPASLASRRAA
jgi:F-type H+-transporting ATPase subunit b